MSGGHGAKSAVALPSAQPDSEAKPSSSRSPRLDRARTRAKAEYRRALDGKTSKEALFLGVSKQVLSQLCDEDDQRCPSLAHVFAGTAEVKRAIARALLGSADDQEDNERAEHLLGEAREIFDRVGRLVKSLEATGGRP